MRCCTRGAICLASTPEMAEPSMEPPISGMNSQPKEVSSSRRMPITNSAAALM